MSQPLRDLFLLDEGLVFLNHGSFGACPRPVFDTYQRWQRELERQPVEFLARRLPSEMADARRVLADWIGADADDLIYVTNATTGLNVVAKSLRLEPGDEVLASDQEYGALDRTWTFICERQGARYVRARVPLPARSPEGLADAIWDYATSRTRALFLSHIASPTGILFPVAELVRRARAAGILSVIDGAHAPGQVPINLRALGADFYVGNCHKWMMAPKGSGFLHARPGVQRLLDPLVVSWGWRSDRPSGSLFVDHHEWQGTRDVSAFLSVPAAIRFLQEYDWPAVVARCHELLSWARGRIVDVVGLPPVVADSPDLYVQMASFTLPSKDAERIQTRLRTHCSIEVPAIPFLEAALLRVSVQGYNTREDLDALVDALCRVRSG